MTTKQCGNGGGGKGKGGKAAAIKSAGGGGGTDTVAVRATVVRERAWELGRKTGKIVGTIGSALPTASQVGGARKRIEGLFSKLKDS